jgi:branched-chain amino acid transport system permease protein
LEKLEASAAGEFLKRRDGVRAIETVPWVAAVAFPMAFPDYALLGTHILIVMLFALSLDVIVGYAGIVTLGHAAYFGVGAYTAGLVSARMGWSEPISALLAAGIAAGAFGLVTGSVLLRYHHLALIMLTLVLSTMVFELGNTWTSLTGGWDGLMGIRLDPLLGLFEWDLRGVTSYGYALSVLMASFWWLRFLSASPFMQGLRGISENRARMRAIGTPITLHLLIAFTLSAALAGLAGALFAQANAFITIEVLGFERSAAVLTVLILGGVGRLYGALAGALVFIAAADWLAKASPVYWEFGVGLLLVLVVLLFPNGIVGGIERLRARYRRPWT